MTYVISVRPVYFRAIFGSCHEKRALLLTADNGPIGLRMRSPIRAFVIQLYTVCMLWVHIRNASAIIFWHENMLWILLGTVSEVLLMITHYMFSCRNKKDNSIFVGEGRGGMKSLSGAMCRAISAGHVRHKFSFYLECQIIIGATLGGNGSAGQRSVRILLSVDIS